MNKSLLAAVAAGAILLLSGCSPIQMDVEELMSPPKLTAEQAEIDSALKQALGENVKLKYPKSGDFRSAFVFHDIDGDGRRGHRLLPVGQQQHHLAHRHGPDGWSVALHLQLLRAGG